MLTVSYRPEDSKALYFRINSSLNLLDTPLSPTFKLPGVYAIFKQDTCFYVGQSKNVASRLATHITGKYKKADKIIIFPPAGEECGCLEFYDLTTENQSHILRLNESILIDRLKPIENILTEYNSDNTYDFVFDIFEAYNDCIESVIQYAPVQILLDDLNILVQDGVLYQDLYMIPYEYITDFVEEQRQITEFLASKTND